MCGSSHSNSCRIRISKFLLNFGCLFTCCYLQGHERHAKMLMNYAEGVKGKNKGKNIYVYVVKEVN